METAKRLTSKGDTPDARSASAARTYPTTVPIEAHLRVPTPIAGVPMQSQACGTEPIAEPSGPLVTPLISTLSSTFDTTFISTLSSTLDTMLVTPLSSTLDTLLSSTIDMTLDTMLSSTLDTVETRI